MEDDVQADPTAPGAAQTTPVALISVSMDLGAGRRGVDMGPSALRIAGVAEAVRDLGREVREAGTVQAPPAELGAVGDEAARFLAEIRTVVGRARDHVDGALRSGSVPVVLGGDHSLSIGTVSAVAAHHRERGEEIGLLWIDAHTDLNTPATSPSGNVHGMGLSALLGRGPEELVAIGGGEASVRPERVCVLGAREIDREERERVRSSGIRVYTMYEVDERGLPACLDAALERVSRDTAGFCLSFDLDAIDPMVAPGVGTPVKGGLTYREAHLICEKAARTGRLLSFEVVELNPVLDEGNRTARLGVGLVESALGKAIL